MAEGALFFWVLPNVYLHFFVVRPFMIRPDTNKMINKKQFKISPENARCLVKVNKKENVNMIVFAQSSILQKKTRINHYCNIFLNYLVTLGAIILKNLLGKTAENTIEVWNRLQNTSCNFPHVYIVTAKIRLFLS